VPLSAQPKSAITKWSLVARPVAADKAARKRGLARSITSLAPQADKE